MTAFPSRARAPNPQPEGGGRPRGSPPGRRRRAGTPRSSLPGVPFGRHDVAGHQPPDLLQVLRLHPVLEVGLPIRPVEQVRVRGADAVQDRPSLERVGDDLRVILPAVLGLDVVDLSPEPYVMVESREHPHLRSALRHVASPFPIRAAPGPATGPRGARRTRLGRKLTAPSARTSTGHPSRGTRPPRPPRTGGAPAL